MKTGNWNYVYLTSDTMVCTDSFGIWNTNIGIVKYRGCVEFRSARSLKKTGKYDNYEYVGKIYSGCACGRCDEHRIKKQFGFVPARGTAWLVNTTTLKCKRIDKDMALIDPDTGKVVG